MTKTRSSNQNTQNAGTQIKMSDWVDNYSTIPYHTKRYLDAFANIFAIQEPVAAVIYYNNSFFLSYNDNLPDNKVTIVTKIKNAINKAISQEKIDLNELLELYIKNNSYFHNFLKILSSNLNEIYSHEFKELLLKIQNKNNNSNIIIKSYCDLLNKIEDFHNLNDFDKENLVRPIQDISKLLFILKSFTSIEVCVLENPQKLHAEINIACNFPFLKPEEYIGVSFLCCGACDYFLTNSVMKFEHRGTHGKWNLNWKAGIQQLERYKNHLFIETKKYCDKQVEILNALQEKLNYLLEEFKKEDPKNESLTTILAILNKEEYKNNFMEELEKFQQGISALTNNFCKVMNESTSFVVPQLISNEKLLSEIKTFSDRCDRCTISSIDKALRIVNDKIKMLEPGADRQAHNLGQYEKNLITIIENFSKDLNLIEGCKSELEALVRTKANDPSTRRLSIDINMEEKIKLVLQNNNAMMCYEEGSSLHDLKKNNLQLTVTGETLEETQI